MLALGADRRGRRDRDRCDRARGSGPHDPAVLLAIPAAISGTLGLYAYYRGMAIGAMAVVAPIAGASAIVPVVFGIARGDRPVARCSTRGSPARSSASFLASQEHQAGGQRRVAAGVGLALARRGRLRLLLPADARRRARPTRYWASLIFRFTALLIVAVAALVRRPRAPARRLEAR